MNYFLIYTIALVTTLLLVPPIKHLARFTGVMDEPNDRKVHTHRVPRMGGLAMFFGVLVTFAIFFSEFSRFKGIFLGMVIIVIVGLIDDTIGLEPRYKFMGQIVAAMAPMLISDVSISFLGGVVGSNFSMGILSFPLTLFWIVGITNAINLSDGLDGLASGISLIAFTSFGFLAYQRGDMVLLALCLALIGSILGFLKYNTHPAEIFMGDTGSLFLGYSLGTLSLAGNFKSLTTMTLITPVLVLLVPISDTIWAIIRRLKESRSPFSADKMHFHHQLLRSGMNQSQTVSVIYALSAGLSLFTVALANSSNLKYFLVPILALAMIVMIAQIAGFIKLQKWTHRASEQFDRWFPFKLQNLLSQFFFRLVQVGFGIYVLAFAVGLPWVPSNLLLIAAFTMTLVLYLLIARSQNGQSFLFFSLFFLAAIMVVVTQQLRLHNDAIFGLPFSVLEAIAFWLLVIGVLGKIIFNKQKEIFLTTPLDFFIFLILVGVAFVPAEIQLQYSLPHLVLRSVFVFLAFKIIVLMRRRQERSFAAVLTAGVLFIFFGVVI